MKEKRRGRNKKIEEYLFCYKIGLHNKLLLFKTFLAFLSTHLCLFPMLSLNLDEKKSCQSDDMCIVYL